MYVCVDQVAYYLGLVEQAIWAEEMATFDAIVEDRQKVCEDGSDFPEGEGNNLIQTLVNGQATPADLRDMTWQIGCNALACSYVGQP